MKPKDYIRGYYDHEYERALRGVSSNTLAQYGTPRHSGRYPWGSGDNPYQSEENFMSHIHDLRSKGLTDVQVAKSMGMNTTIMRKEISRVQEAAKAYRHEQVWKLRDKGMSPAAISKRTGYPDSTIRYILSNRDAESNRVNSSRQIANVLKEAVEKTGYLDVGSGTEEWLGGISKGKLATALQILQKEEGYSVIPNVRYAQLGTSHETKFKVLAKPGTTWQDAMKHLDQIAHMHDDVYSEDQGHTIRKKEKPVSVDSKRIQVVYNEEGGIDKDGLIELRRGVDDISLGEAKYAQVRIAVDGSHYLKGMATYADDLPDGVDIRFNTNKHVGTPIKGHKDNSVLKELKTNPDGSINWDNPFGATIHEYDKNDIAKEGSDDSLIKNGLIRAQRHYIGSDGKEHLSALNIVNEEGAWNKWSRVLASQFLSKQPLKLAQKQLDLAYDVAIDEFKEILAYNNPTAKKALLQKFASQCDSDATDLHAAPLPGQTTKVLIPFTDIKKGECYCPNLKDGEKVALVRYPHGGIFEIPVLTVNNRTKGPRKTIENALDAIGVNKETADKLSGADFDGDTAIVLPLRNVNIRTDNLPKRLVGFDPKEEYRGYPGMKVMKKRETGLEMGRITNLITDMTIKGATLDEIAEATRHSMVVIDARKHELDYKKSEVDHHIAELKEKYQGGKNKGASTLISQSTKELRNIPVREEQLPSRMTPDELERWKKGEMIYRDAGYTYSKKKVAKDGTVTYEHPLKTMKIPMMQNTNDAFDLVSRDKNGEPAAIEVIYANYANKMKNLANRARAVMRSTGDIEYDPNSRKIYASEVASLNDKLHEAQKNSPLERDAQLAANKRYAIAIHDNPEMDDESKKKLKGQVLDEARRVVGAHKKQVTFTQREWEAINAGAVSKSILRSLLANADPKNVRELALPREKKIMSAAKTAKAKALLNNHHTYAEVAEALGCSVSTLVRAIGESD